LHEYLVDFPGQQDALRYVLCTNAPENKDGDFSWRDFQAKNNNELVAVLGNFVNRTFVLVHKYFGGTVPVRGAMAAVDTALADLIAVAPGEIGEAIAQYKFKEGLQRCMDLARAGNKYLADTEPWHLIKTDKERVGTVLSMALQLMGNLVILLAPFLPFTSRRLGGLLGNASLEPSPWDQAGNLSLVAAGTALKEPTLLFEKITDETIAAQEEKLRETCG
jgi:methionyl-tRNA synthetase